MKILTTIAILFAMNATAQQHNQDDVLPHVYTVQSVVNQNTVSMSLNGFTYNVRISNFKDGDLTKYIGRDVKLLKEHYGHDGTITALMFQNDKLVTFN